MELQYVQGLPGLLPKTDIGPTIQLQSGEYFDILDPWNSILTIDDIANGLSKICRFTGHCSKFYSVAEHCVYVSLIVPEEYALEGLLHDASEAFIGDVSKPLKNVLPDYRAIEEDVEKCLADRFGLPYPMSPVVKQADMQMLRTEQHNLMPEGPGWDLFKGLKPVDITLWCHPWDVARQNFLDRYEELLNG